MVVVCKGTSLPDARARLSGSRDEIRVVTHGTARLGQRGDDPRQRGGGDAVNVVVEGARLRGVPLQQTLPVSRGVSSTAHRINPTQLSATAGGGGRRLANRV